ncbi:unnamed protein product [Menidia menidia]|uniref:(Atlantic silverside) hypothetical protein n=1 Tax=Menidia menidia TaxID=238744 RepID=A0A8S4B6L6_9TELE|nr:unnamed protein product [Menidia menidia]
MPYSDLSFSCLAMKRAIFHEERCLHGGWLVHRGHHRGWSTDNAFKLASLSHWVDLVPLHHHLPIQTSPSVMSLVPQNRGQRLCARLAGDQTRRLDSLTLQFPYKVASETTAKLSVLSITNMRQQQCCWLGIAMITIEFNPNSTDKKVSHDPDH